MREIVFDLETTGFDGKAPERIVEIGAIEIVDLKPTGKVYHQIINPERDILKDAIKIHGITDEKVIGCPTFKEIVDDFIDFIGEDSKLIAHNAKSYDKRVINDELQWANNQIINSDRFFDTLPFARIVIPKTILKNHKLDTLCDFFNIDNSHRQYHGALLDSELLLDVYIGLCQLNEKIINKWLEDNPDEAKKILKKTEKQGLTGHAKNSEIRESMKKHNKKGKTKEKIDSIGLSPNAKDSKLNGKTIVFTGKLYQMSRSEAEEKARYFGAEPKRSISKKLDYVVLGEDAGVKAQKAEDLKLQILTEQEFLDMIN